MTSIVLNITFDCADPRAVARFWSAVTGGRVEWESLADGSGYAVLSAGQLPRMVFVQVPEGKSVKNRVHLDIVPVDRGQQAEIERLTRLGATIVDDRRDAGGPGWVILADPEGNEFCVERGGHQAGVTS